MATVTSVTDLVVFFLHTCPVTSVRAEINSRSTGYHCHVEK